MTLDETTKLLESLIKLMEGSEENVAAYIQAHIESIQYRLHIVHCIALERYSSNHTEIPQDITKNDDELAESEILCRPVEYLDLTIRAMNCLKSENILTFRNLISHTEEDLLRIRNLGKGSLKEIKEALKRHNLYLKGDN